MKNRLSRFILISLSVLCIFMTGCKKSNIQKIDPPTQEDLQKSNLQGIMQTDEVEDYYLTDYTIENGKIVYEFTDSVGEKDKISVTGIKMSYEDYVKSLPNGDLKETIINGINCLFIDRTVHYVPDGYKPDKRVQNNVNMGTTEIKYGNPDDLDELLPIQHIYWYDDATQIAYNIEAMGKYYQMADMGIYVSNYMEESQDK